MKVTRKERLKNLRKWVKALRSGKYRQTTGTLQEGASHGGHTKYCCLGVACKVLGLPKDDWYDLGTLPIEATKLLGINAFGALPNSIDAGDVVANDLTDLNDNAGYSFKQIAKVIEKQFIAPLVKSKKKVVAVKEEE